MGITGASGRLLSGLVDAPRGLHASCLLMGSHLRGLTNSNTASVHVEFCAEKWQATQVQQFARSRGAKLRVQDLRSGGYKLVRNCLETNKAAFRFGGVDPRIEWLDGSRSLSMGSSCKRPNKTAFRFGVRRGREKERPTAQRVPASKFQHGILPKTGTIDTSNIATAAKCLPFVFVWYMQGQDEDRFDLATARVCRDSA